MDTLTLTFSAIMFYRLQMILIRQNHTLDFIVLTIPIPIQKVWRIKLDSIVMYFSCRLIAEVPETLSDTSSVDPNLNQQPVVETVEKIEVQTEESAPESSDNELSEYYVASYLYQSQETGDLSFNAGDMITVTKKEGDWWTGKIGSNVGIFPSNYVQRTDMNAAAVVSIAYGWLRIVTNVSEGVQTVPTNNTEQVLSQAQDSGTDNEVSQINDNTVQLEKSPDFASMAANTQVCVLLYIYIVIKGTF